MYVPVGRQKLSSPSNANLLFVIEFASSEFNSYGISTFISVPSEVVVVTLSVKSNDVNVLAGNSIDIVRSIQPPVYVGEDDGSVDGREDNVGVSDGEADGSVDGKRDNVGVSDGEIDGNTDGKEDNVGASVGIFETDGDGERVGNSGQ